MAGREVGGGALGGVELGRVGAWVGGALGGVEHPSIGWGLAYVPHIPDGWG